MPKYMTYWNSHDTVDIEVEAENEEAAVEAAYALLPDGDWDIEFAEEL